MPDLLLFIKNNQSTELANWGAGQPALGSVDTTKAWEIISNNILKDSAYNDNTLAIIIELLRWNNSPAWLFKTGKENFLYTLILNAADTNDVSYKNDLLCFATHILNHVDMDRVPSEVCWEMAISCIKITTENETDKNIKNYAIILSSLLSKCPYLIKTHDQADIVFSYQAKKVRVNNLLSFIIWKNKALKKELPILDSLLANILVHDDKVRLADIPFKLHYELRAYSITWNPIAGFNVNEDLNSHIAVDSYADDKKMLADSIADDKKMLAGSVRFEGFFYEELFYKSHVYIREYNQLNAAIFYFTYPINSGRDFDFIKFFDKNFICPMQKEYSCCDDIDGYDDIDMKAAVSQAMNKLIDHYDSSLLSFPKAFTECFDTNNYLVKDYTISNVNTNIDMRNYILQVDKDRQNISLMNEKFKVDATKETILEEINQFLVTLTNNFDRCKPVNLFEDKFNNITQKILLDTLYCKDLLSLLGERQDNLDLIDNVLDILTDLQQKLATANKQPAFMIPVIFYQLKVKQVYSKYQEADKELDKLNGSDPEILHIVRQNRLSQYFTEVINMLDIYIQARSAELGDEFAADNNIIPHLTLNHFNDIPVAEILEEIQSKQLLKLPFDTIDKIINISQAAHVGAGNSLNELISLILRKAKVYKILYALYEAKENESFYLHLSQHSDIFGPLSEHVRLMGVAVRIISKLFRQGGKFYGVILLDKDQLEEWQENLKIFSTYHLEPLLDMINQTKLLPDFNENNFFNVIINTIMNEIITATLDIIQQVILQVQNKKYLCNCENVHESIKASLQWGRDVVSVLLDQTKQINKFISDDLKKELEIKLAVIDEFCEPLKLLALQKKDGLPSLNPGQQLGRWIVTFFTPARKQGDSFVNISDNVYNYQKKL